jgi:hypothetical protein
MPKMPARSKKERKQKKRQERNRREAQRRAKRDQESAGGRTVPAPHLTPPRSKPAPPQRREQSPIDLWWDDYVKADGEGRLRMVREKLRTIEPESEWYEALFPEAIDELQSKLPSERYVAFLEELLDQHPGVFDISADWNAWSMAFVYIADERYEDLDRVVRRVAGALQTMDAPSFSLISLLRLAGRDETAQALIDAATPLIDSSGLMGWAEDELIERTLFAAYQRCVAAGATDEAVEDLYRFSSGLGVKDSKRARRDQRDFVLHLAGKADRQWSRDEFLKDGKKVGRRAYLLLADFSRWLCHSRDIPAIVADEFRRILVTCIDQMDCPVNSFMKGLKRAEFEPFLVRKLGFMSLDRFHAPATVIGMFHFYDFLVELDLVDEKTRRSAGQVCIAMWKELKRALKREWRNHQFLERYLPKPSPVL